MTSYHVLRRATGAVLLTALVGLPFVRINGESALRFDIPTLSLLFFGSRIGLADSFILLIALIFITFFILLATTLFGRLWCGWFCPQTVLCDATSFMERRSGSFPARALSVLSGALLSGIIAASLIAYFVAPHDIPDLLLSDSPAASIVKWSWIALAALLYLDLVLLRRDFCSTVCPYAKMQGVLFDDRTLLVAFDAGRSEECMDCRACVRACPVRIDVRKGAQSACIHCAECVDACSRRMAARNKTSLIDYFFGEPKAGRRGLRINVLITGVMTVLSLLLLLWLLWSKMPFDATLRLDYTDEPMQQADGSVTNVYELSLRNLTTTDLELTISATSAGAQADVSPQRMLLRQGQDIVRTPAAITLRDVPAGLAETEVQLIVSSRLPQATVTRIAHFMLPQKR